VLAPPLRSDHPSPKSAALSTGAIARSAGPAAVAASHCVAPMYECPAITTRPSHHGWAATQALESGPSPGSSTNGSNAPSESPRPRTSCRTGQNPRSSTMVAPPAHAARGYYRLRTP
jgi:hypothetical protein